MTAARIAVVSTVKAPVAVLRPWIMYHLRIGIERFFLFQDDPADGMHERLADIAQLTVVPCNGAYWASAGGARPDGVPSRQIVNVERGIAMAAAAGCDWVAHIDCDELIRPLGELDDVLSASHAAAVKMTVLEAVAERLEYRSIFDASLFKRVPTRARAITARLLGCRRSFSHGEYFRGHTASKVLARTDGSVVRMGVHKPIELAAGANAAETADIQLLHYDCVGFADWDQKWRARSEDQHADEGFRPARIRQFEAYKNADRLGYEARVRLFRETQLIPGREMTVLNRLGLLTRIELDPGLFSG